MEGTWVTSEPLLRISFELFPASTFFIVFENTDDSKITGLSSFPTMSFIRRRCIRKMTHNLKTPQDKKCRMRKGLSLWIEAVKNEETLNQCHRTWGLNASGSSLSMSFSSL